MRTDHELLALADGAPMDMQEYLRLRELREMQVRRDLEDIKSRLETLERSGRWQRYHS